MAGTGPATCPFPTRLPCGGCLLAAVLAPWAAHNRSCQRGVSLEAEAWAPMRRVPGEESARGATKSPASPAGPAGDQSGQPLWEWGTSSAAFRRRLRGTTSGLRRRSNLQFSTSLWAWPAPPGLSGAAWAAWGCSSRLAPLPWARGGHQGNAGSGAAQGDLEVHGSHRCWGMAPDLFKFGPIRMQASQLDHGRV